MPSALLAALQFFFALTWVVYVIYLPALVEQAGMDRRYVPMILLMDQVVFLAFDWAAGLYADRIARRFGRVGEAMAIVTLVSCAAFMLLPWIAPNAGKWPFLLLTILWSATSSALRAPPFAIVSRYAEPSNQPWIACAYLFGLGLASAVAPYLAIELRQFDPRVPFALSSIALAAFVLALARVERAHPPPGPSEVSRVPPPSSRPPLALFALVLLLFAFGYQVHFTINSAPGYLRFARIDDLPHLMPVFWIGFNLALLPAALLMKRHGGAAVMVAAGVVGVLALTACVRVPSLPLLVVAQGFAGAAWSIALTAAFSAALEMGKPGREGVLSGVLFSTLAAAAIARLAIVVSGVQSGTRASVYLESLPFIAWALAAFVMALIAYPERRQPSTS